MFKLVETCLLVGCRGEDGELSVVAEEMVEDPGLVIDCCIGEGKVLVPLLVDADDSEAPGGLKADEDNWQLFVFVQDDVIEVPAVAHGGGGGAVAVVPVPKAVVAVVGEAKLLGGLEGIGST